MAINPLAVIARGLRPVDVKASLNRWLGQELTLENHEFWREFMATGSWTGRRVGVDQALQLSTVWACIRLLSETLATLPLGFYKRTGEARKAATEHNLSGLLHNQPNADMTAMTFWQVVVASMLAWGMAWIEVIRAGGVVVSLHFLLPARLRKMPLANGDYEYRYKNDDGKTERTIARESVMAIPAFSLDGLNGLSPIAYGVNVFGTAIETEKASAQTFKGALRASGLIKMDMTLTKDRRNEIREHVKMVADAGGVMVLEKGVGFESLGFDPKTTELLASRAFNVEEICRWFGLDPVMVGHGGKDSNWGTGLEQKMLWFLIFALRKWCVRIEQAIRKDLLTPVERKTYFAEFALEGLLRGDSAGRATFYSTMTQNAIMTRDECRRLENLPPMGGNAEVLTLQVNMIPLDKLGEETAPAPPASPPAVPGLPGDATTARAAMLSWLGLPTE